MKPEIEKLVETYRKNIAEAPNAQDKPDFGKNRQRAEILKQNEIFLKELSGIKNRLGEKYFKLREEEIAEDALESPGRFFSACDGILLKSDFAEPKIIIAHMLFHEHGSDIGYVYYLPGTPIGEDGFPESEIDRERDPLFDGWPLEWIVLDESELELDGEPMGGPLFMSRCKLKVWERYWMKWYDFCTRWHISSTWNGDLQDLHLHSLPSVIVEREDANNPNLPVSIRLSAWATREDVEEAWPAVEQIMKEARVYRERESKNFRRDDIWYRLNKEEHMSPSEIARFWAEKIPKEIDLEVIKKVTGGEDTFEGVPLEERLEETLSDDPKLAELRGRFIEARKTFIRTSLKDKVKKSIINTEKKIKRIGSEDFDRNRLRLLRPPR
jgi:hypothetical protein